MKKAIFLFRQKIFFYHKKMALFRERYILRELVSNASDAISKLKIIDIGEAKLPDDYKPRITVSLNKEKELLLSLIMV